MIEARQKLSYRCGDLRARLTSQINDCDDAFRPVIWESRRGKRLKIRDRSETKRKEKKKMRKRYEKASYLMVVSGMGVDLPEMEKYAH